METKQLPITVSFSSFDEFWNTNSLPSGLQAVLISKMPPDKKEELRERLRTQLPIAADGRISYRAMANAVKGRAPD